MSRFTLGPTEELVIELLETEAFKLNALASRAFLYDPFAA